MCELTKQYLVVTTSSVGEDTVVSAVEAEAMWELNMMNSMIQFGEKPSCEDMIHYDSLGAH